MLHVSLAENTRTNFHGMAMQHSCLLIFLQCVTRQKYITAFPNTKCCENPQNKNKELLLQFSSWAGWLKDTTKAFKPHSHCCQVWDTLCGPAKTRSQKPKIQISSFLPGPQQFSKNFPNQAIPRRFRQKQWVQLHSTTPSLHTTAADVTMSHLWSWTVTHFYPFHESGLCGYNFSWITSCRVRLFPLAPTTGILTAKHIKPYLHGKHFTDHWGC